MDQVVQEYTSCLDSEDSHEVAKVWGMLEERRQAAFRSADPSAKMNYSRLLQELLAYKRGAVVQKLLNQVVKPKPSAGPASAGRRYSLQFKLMMTLGVLSESQAVAEFCLRELGGDIGLLAQEYLISFKVLMWSISNEEVREKQHTEVWLDWILSSLRGIIHFARVSKFFRRSLQESGQDLFPNLEQLLSKDFEKLLPEHRATASLTEINQLVHIFCLFEDSQHWALEQGLIRIEVALIRLATRHAEKYKRSSLGDSDKVIGTEQELLELDKKMRNPEDPPSARAWRARYLEWYKNDILVDIQLNLSLTGLDILGPHQNIDPEKTSKSVKSLAAWASGRRKMPIVCSWELCEAGSVIDAGRLFGRCSKCSLAFYCK